MYTIFSDDVCIYDDMSNQNEYRLVSPSWHREDNTSGTLTFTMPTCNAGYDKMERLKSHIYIYKNGVEVWEGRVISEKQNFNNDREVTCEGVLGYLNDISQPQREFINPTVTLFLKTLLEYYNSKTTEDKRFVLGNVTVNHAMINEGVLDEYSDQPRYVDMYLDPVIDIISDDLYATVSSNNLKHQITTNDKHYYLAFDVRDCRSVELSVSGGTCVRVCMSNTSPDNYYSSIEAGTPFILTGVGADDASTTGSVTSYDVLSNLGNANFLYVYTGNSHGNITVHVSKQVTEFHDVYVYTNFESTFESISEKLINKGTDQYNENKKDLQGHLIVRKEGGIRYLDYLKDFPTQSSQIINFGVNLLDFTADFDESEYCTVLIPLGERYSEGEVEGLEGYLDITEVNHGKNYLVNEAAVERYGWIERVQHFDDIQDDVELYNAGVKYLSDVQFGKMQLNVSAIDLSNFDVNVEEIKLLDEIRVESAPHGLNRMFPVTEIEIPLDNPANTKYTLGLKDVLSSSAMSFYSVYMESAVKESQQLIDNTVREIENEIDDVDDKVDDLDDKVENYYSQTEVNFDVLDDALAAEVRRATNKETEIYSKVTMTAEEIAAEVTRANAEEGRLSSRISVTAEAITSEVTRAQNSEATLRSSITQTATQIAFKVDNGNVSSQLSVESGQIVMQSGRLVIQSGNFQLDASGNATATNFIARESLEVYAAEDDSHVFLQAINGDQLAIMETAEWNDQRFVDLICDDIYCKQVQATGSLNAPTIFTTTGRIEAATYFVSNSPNGSSSSANVYMGADGEIKKSNGSSRRWKNSITTDILPDLDPHKLYDLPVYQYKYNTDYLNDFFDTRYDKPVIGFIAEDLNDIYPVACDYDDLHLPSDWNFRYIVPPMLKLIQEQKTEIDILKNRLSTLEGDNHVS